MLKATSCRPQNPTCEAPALQTLNSTPETLSLQNPDSVVEGPNGQEGALPDPASGASGGLVESLGFGDYGFIMVGR